MKFMVALSFCVALASASVIDEFKSFKAKHNKVYSDEAEVWEPNIVIES